MTVLAHGIGGRADLPVPLTLALYGAGLVVALSFLALVLLVVVGLARRAPTTWWAWAAGSVAGLVVLGSYVYPVIVEPLFSDVRPMTAGPLREDLEKSMANMAATENPTRRAIEESAPGSVIMIDAGGNIGGGAVGEAAADSDAWR